MPNHPPEQTIIDLPMESVMHNSMMPYAEYVIADAMEFLHDTE